jgi:GWxTD domain-containing protein
VPVSKRASIPALLLILAATLSLGPADKPKLPEPYKKWLDEEVVYIITSTERDVFLKLLTDRERQLFVEAFWKHRDPTPNSPENEFKTEHYRRITHANQYLGREASVPGWKTDRGRMYILLGEPQETQRFTGKSGIYDCESWFYQGKAEAGLPAGFYLLFFKDHGLGAYKLYSPLRDGPQALLSSYLDDPRDYLKAARAIQAIEPGLAAISLSLVPGEESGVLGRPSMSSDILIQRIETLPSRAVQDKYARKFLEYKDLVEVEYSANYLDSDCLIKVFKEPSGLYFVHCAVEPQRLSVDQYGHRYSTTLKVAGRVTTLDGRLVYQYDKSVSLDIPETQMNELSRGPFDYQDIFPLVPGDYRVSILVKNEASKEFMSVEQAVRIPGKGTAVEMTQPVLGYKVTRLGPDERKIKAFRIGPYQVYCQPGRVFTAKDTLAVAFQVNDLPADLTRDGQVKMIFQKDGRPFREITRKAQEYPDLPNALEEISLADFPPAHYEVRVSFLNAGAEIVTAREEFDVTFAAALARPWFSSRILPPPGDPVYSEITGAQLFNLGRYAEARADFENAYKRKPDSPDTACNLAQACVALGEYRKAVGVLEHFLSQPQVAKYEILVLAGEAYRKSGEFARAVEVLDKAVSHYGVNAALLNGLGESYLGLQKLPEARAAFEKSLRLLPDQPEIRKKLDDLNKRK